MTEKLQGVGMKEGRRPGAVSTELTTTMVEREMEVPECTAMVNAGPLGPLMIGGMLSKMR